MTEERRKKLVRVVRQIAESARIAIRNIRRDSKAEIKALLKDKIITEDEEKRAEDDIQKVTDKFIAEVDKLLAEKEADLLKV